MKNHERLQHDLQWSPVKPTVSEAGLGRFSKKSLQTPEVMIWQLAIAKGRVSSTRMAGSYTAGSYRRILGPQSGH